MELHVLGPIEVLESGDPIGLGGPKPRTALAVLIANLGNPVSADTLVACVYGNDPPPGARRSIQTYVSALHGSLGDVITTQAGGYVLTVPRSSVDACRLEDAVDSADDTDTTGTLEALNQALGAWRGDPYADIDGLGFLDPEITRLHELRLRALEERVEANLALGRHRQLVEELESLVQEYPLSERFCVQLMLALYRSGRQAEALRAAAAARSYFAEELGLDPPPLVGETEQQILDQDPDLKFRPRLRRAGLPARYSSFVGREEAMETIGRTVGRGRLVSVIGAGGVGKSSVAVEAVRAEKGSYDVICVDIESTKIGDVAPAVAKAMGLEPTPADDPLDLIVEALSVGSPLLVLDGCEQVLDDVVKLVDRVLTASSRPRILITSREALNVGGENRILLDPMETGRGSEAEELFCVRAGIDPADSSEGDRDAISATCLRLDGVPLAIEIAASRTRSMSLMELADNLDHQMDLLSGRPGASDRHSSLRASLDLSYRLLDPELQQAFRRLAVFTSGIPQDGAAVVLGSDQGTLLLARLVESSLLVPPDDNGRYHMLEPVRQYAWALLEEESELEDTRDRHTQWVVTLADELGMRQHMPPSQLGFRLHDERSEIIEAMRWSLSSDRPRAALAITSDLGFLWTGAGDLRVIHDLAVQAIEHPDAARDDTLTRAMAVVAWMHDSVEDHDLAVDLIEKAYRLVEDSTDDRTLFDVVGIRAFIPGGSNLFYPLADPLQILELWERAIEHGVRAGFRREDLTYNRALILGWAGRPEEAQSIVRQLLKSHVEMYGEADPIVYLHLAMQSLNRGEPEEAIALAQEAAEGFAGAGAWRGAARSHRRAAWVLDLSGRSAEAVAELDTAQGIRASIGRAPLEEDLPMTSSRISANTGQWTETARTLRRFTKNLGLWREDPQIWHVTLQGRADDMYGGFVPILKPLAQWLVHEGRLEEAASLAAAVPGLMQLTPYKNWDNVGELQFWEQLSTELGPPEEEGPTTLEDAYDWMARVMDVELDEPVPS